MSEKQIDTSETTFHAEGDYSALTVPHVDSNGNECEKIVSLMRNGEKVFVHPDFRG